MKAHETNGQKWDLIVTESPQRKKWLKVDFIKSPKRTLIGYSSRTALKLQLD